MINKYVKPLAFTMTSALMTISPTVINFVQADELKITPNNTQPVEVVPVTAKSILMAKLANVDHFSANFNQEVLSESGEMLEQSSGELAISKPNLASWYTIEPDELKIVSDGQDVWFYNPWIEQVSVYSLSAAIAKTPILLLTSKDEALWQQYNVTQKVAAETSEIAEISSTSFVISAKDVNSQIKSLTLVFEPNEKGGQLKQFSFLDATGQLSHIKLSDFNAQNIPAKTLFSFVLPDGVQVDDQRTN
jgi:outer membrane lipoprotein carrier protein